MNDSFMEEKNKRGKERGVRLLFFCLGMIVGALVSYYYFGILNSDGLFTSIVKFM